jgi:hypothetical protein
MTPKASRKKRNMGEVIADGWVDETVEAVDFAAPHDFGERHPAVQRKNLDSSFPVLLRMEMRVRFGGRSHLSTFAVTLLEKPRPR